MTTCLSHSNYADCATSLPARAASPDRNLKSWGAMLAREIRPCCARVGCVASFGLGLARCPTRLSRPHVAATELAPCPHDVFAAQWPGPSTRRVR